MAPDPDLQTVDQLPVAEKPGEETRSEPPDSELDIVAPNKPKSRLEIKAELKQQLLSLLAELDKAIPDK